MSSTSMFRDGPSCFVAEPFPLLLVQLLFLCQIEHVTPWGNACVFQLAVLLDFVWLFRGCNEMAQKNPGEDFLLFPLQCPTSSKITGTLGNLGGYIGFSCDFSLHFLFCIRPVATVFFLILKGFWQYIAVLTIHIRNICT